MTDVCIITLIPSPYQAELFNEVARRGNVRLKVVYLDTQVAEHPWGVPVLEHECCFIKDSEESREKAWRWCFEAGLVVINFYLNAFSLKVLYWRALRERPWVFWGERPGAIYKGRWARTMRRLLLWPLRDTRIPIWGAGRFALSGYEPEWGRQRSYVNLPYFSDLARFQAEKAPPAQSDRFVFLYSGVLNRRKNVLSLAEAFRDVAKADAHVELWVLGDGRLRDEMEKILTPVASQVRWFGFLKWEAIPGIYAQANVLCLPSIYDGWGMVIAEALATGMPVITTTAVGAAHDLVEPGVNGWIVPVADTDALTDAIREAAQLPPAQYQTMRESARQAVSQHTLATGAARLELAVQEAMPSDPEVTQSPLADLHVLLATTYQPDGLQSMERYARLVKSALEAHGVSVTELHPSTFFGQWALRGPRLLKKYLGFLDKYVVFPLALRFKHARREKDRRTLLHVTDQGNALFSALVNHLPTLVTCHDLIAASDAQRTLNDPQAAPSPTWFQQINLAVLARAGTIICVSQKTLRDCQVLIKGSDPRLLCIPNPIDPIFLREAPVPKPAGLPRRYLLHVGNDAWYKNREGLIHIYAALLPQLPEPLPLVMVGATLNAREKQTIHALGLTEQVINIANVSEDTVIAAYRDAEALIFPSLQEGFGWPVLEAMASGCPVFASDRAPHTEVGGDAIVYFDPQDPEAAAQLIADRMKADPEWRTALSEAGSRRAREFTLERFGEQLLAAYELALREYPLEVSRD